MKDSGLDSAAVIARRAGSYTVTPNGLVHASYASDRIVPNAAAGLYSTTEDLLRWQNGLYGGQVVSKASLQKMTTPFKGDYGLGVYIRTIDGRRAATHGGGAPPFANLTYFFDRGISVVVLGKCQHRAVSGDRRVSGRARARRHGPATVGEEGDHARALDFGSLRGRLPVRQRSDDDRQGRWRAARGATNRR
jgi:hypothetical protein